MNGSENGIHHTRYCHSACKIATAILKNFRRKRKGLIDKDKPEVKKDFLTSPLALQRGKEVKGRRIVTRLPSTLKSIGSSNLSFLPNHNSSVKV